MDKYNITFTLKGDKTWQDILHEAKEACPNDEQAQIEYGANLMRGIGFDTEVSTVQASGL